MVAGQRLWAHPLLQASQTTVSTSAAVAFDSRLLLFNDKRKLLTLPT